MTEVKGKGDIVNGSILPASLHCIHLEKAKVLLLLQVQMQVLLDDKKIRDNFIAGCKRNEKRFERIKRND